MKLLKKTFALMLSLILVVGMIPGTMTAYAAGTSGGGFTLTGDTAEWNVSISDAGVLSWDNKGSGYTYKISVAHYGTGGTVTHIDDLSTNSCNLKAKFEERKIESGSYYFMIEATKGGSTISTGVYDMQMLYVSALPKLAEPQQLQWTADGKQKWEPVAGATGYIFKLYDAEGTRRASTTTTKTEASQWADDGYWFTVQATADGYRNSNAAESPKYGEVVTPPVDTTINIVEATVKEPEAGETPANATVNTTGAKIFSTDWYDGDTQLDADDKFESGKTYKCVVIVHPEDGYKFSDRVTLEINGEAAPIVARESDYINALVKFEVETLPSVITELNATVVEPSIGGTPATTATTTGTDYTVSVSLWFEDATTFDETSFDGVFHGTSFEENVAYGVAIKFTAEEGKTIASERTVTINGKTAHLFNYRLDGTEVTYRVKFDKLEAETPAPTEYDITVTGGTASANKAVAGTSITLTAEQIDGKVFSHWEVNGATVSDANAKETTFTMGNADVTAEAIYDDCECKCHGNFFQKLIFMITNFFAKLFNPAKRVCECGAKH